ncbi:MAG: phosphoribosylamine--glycine ligase [Spirochaetales bacterium]|nr:phosphoribosylamine--glycine ligase [Spirochaetales bacterium]
MKVLVLGSGAREHSVTWKYANSKRISGLYIAPGNCGTGELGTNLPDVNPENIDSVLAACEEYGINQVFVGSEAPLALGIVDGLKEKGIPVFGPHKAAARLESSKTFSKNFMEKYSIPTARAKEFSDKDAFCKYIDEIDFRVVIKKNGLAAGKGVLESEDKEEIKAFGTKVLEDDTLLVEEFLTGFEVSIFALTDGLDYVLLPTCADFKKAGENDKGLNTGGMGAICPVPIIGSALMEEIKKTIVVPTFDGMTAENLGYQGILYFGLMITEKGPYLLEYNTRFGDPETQVLLPLIESDFGNLIEAILNQKLGAFPLRISHKSALGVVVAAEGYPGDYEKGLKVKPIPVFPEDSNLVFHASTVTNENRDVLTSGGRCFTVVGLGQNILNARTRAYEAVARVNFSGSWFRSDIGKKYFND